MNEVDPYKHIRALAQSITDMQKQIDQRDPDAQKPVRQQRKNDAGVGAMAETLRAARTRKKLTQRELGRLAGVPQSHISKIEAGGVDLRLSSLLALAQVLELTLSLAPAAAAAPAVADAEIVHNGDPVVPIRHSSIAPLRYGQAVEDIATTSGRIAQ